MEPAPCVEPVPAPLRCRRSTHPWHHQSHAGEKARRVGENDERLWACRRSKLPSC